MENYNEHEETIEAMLKEYGHENDRNDYNDYFNDIMGNLMEGDSEKGIEMFNKMPTGLKIEFCCGIHEDDVDETIDKFNLKDLI
jgi:hypothetical protein